MSLPQITLPSGIPRFLAESYAAEDDSAYAGVPAAVGASRRRRISSTGERRIVVEWSRLTPLQMQAVDAWYEDTLQVGSLPFAAYLPNLGPGAAWWKARWLSPYTAVVLPGNRWRVTGTLILEGDGSATGPEPTGLGIEVSVALAAVGAIIGAASLALELSLPLLSGSVTTKLGLEVSLPLTQPGATLLGVEVTLPLAGAGVISSSGVKSVALALPASIFTITGSPVIDTGTLTGSFNTQNANLVFAGPASGAAAVPTMRSLVYADLPSISSLLDTAFGSTQGSILVRNAGTWTVLGPGTSGHVLQTGGAGANPAWAAPSGGGGGGGAFTEGPTAPSSPAAGDRWFFTTPGVLLTRIANGGSPTWVEF